MGAAAPVQEAKASAVKAARGEESRWENPKVSGIVCRFCRGPLDLSGDFCEQCGAPVEDAAPPGMVKPRPKPAPPTPPAPPAPSLTGEAGAGRRSLDDAAVPAAPAPPTPVRQVKPDALTLKNLAPLRPPVRKPPASPVDVSPAPGAPAKAQPAGAPAPAMHHTVHGPAAPRPAAEEPTRVIAIPLDLVLLGVLGLVIVIGVLWWVFGRSKPAPPPPPPVTMTEPVTPPAAIESSTETPPAMRKPARAEKPAERPALPATPAVAPNSARLEGLRKKAQQAFFTERYVLPADSSALAYVNQALAIDPNDAYSRKLLESTVGKGKDQVQRALTANDFGTARRVADTMFQTLPGRKDVAALRSQVAAAEAAEADHKAASASVGVLNYNLYHMHTDRAPADGGPYCQGVLIVKGQTMRFTGKSATDGNAHTLDFNCGNIREIKSNRRVATNQNGFHIRTDADNFNFVPVDGSPTVVTMLSAACGQ